MWRKRVDKAPRQNLPLTGAAITSKGVVFSVVEHLPAGRIIYEFEGAFDGAIPEEAFAKTYALNFGPDGPHLNDTGSTLNQIQGTVKITGPDGTVYKTKWSAVRDTTKRGKVEFGAPYEVK